jgi:hypothetical protein
MPARRYRTEINGGVRVVLEFDSDADLDEFLGSRGIVLIQAQTPATPIEAGHEPRRGRPSFGAVIAAAVTALEAQLAGSDSLSERARLVLRHLAQSHAAEDLPTVSTVRAFLAERRPVAEKSANKYANKSKRARIRRTGGN